MSSKDSSSSEGTSRAFSCTTASSRAQSAAPHSIPQLEESPESKYTQSQELEQKEIEEALTGMSLFTPHGLHSSLPSSSAAAASARDMCGKLRITVPMELLPLERAEAFAEFFFQRAGELWDEWEGNDGIAFMGVTIRIVTIGDNFTKFGVKFTLAKKVGSVPLSKFFRFALKKFQREAS